MMKHQLVIYEVSIEYQAGTTDITFSNILYYKLSLFNIFICHNSRSTFLGLQTIPPLTSYFECKAYEKWTETKALWHLNNIQKIVDKILKKRKIIFQSTIHSLNNIQYKREQKDRQKSHELVPIRFLWFFFS